MLNPAEILRVSALRAPLRAIVPQLIADTERATGKGVSFGPLAGVRTYAQQAALKAAEDSNPYPVAAPGSSRHEYGGAADLTIRNGTESDYAQLAQFAENKYGLVAGYYFTRPDGPHVQLDETLDQARAAWYELTKARNATWTIAGALGVGVLVYAMTSNQD